VLTIPIVAWVIHAVALWTWHVPALFEAVLHNEWVHTAQHLSFLLSALLFWWALIHGRQGWMGYGAAALYVFTTSLHSGLLGALLTFSKSVWYPSYVGLTNSWGLTPLEDQQLGGLISRQEPHRVKDCTAVCLVMTTPGDELADHGRRKAGA